jgi:DNA-binding GntR family transcriptional regulator
MSDSPLPLRREPLRVDVADALYGLIVGGHLQPGERIRDSEIAVRLGVSRTPVREALLRLAGEGLVVGLAGRGFRVAALSEREARELYPILSTLESLALRASPALSSTDRLALEGIADQIVRAPSAPHCVQLDLEWHALLLHRCRNEALLQMIGDLKRRLRRYELWYMEHEDLVDASRRDHRRIAALAAKDPATAAEVLSEHWDRALEDLARRIAGSGGSA